MHTFPSNSTCPLFFFSLYYTCRFIARAKDECVQRRLLWNVRYKGFSSECIQAHHTDMTITLNQQKTVAAQFLQTPIVNWRPSTHGNSLLEHWAVSLTLQDQVLQLKYLCNLTVLQQSRKSLQCVRTTNGIYWRYDCNCWLSIGW